MTRRLLKQARNLRTLVCASAFIILAAFSSEAAAQEEAEQVAITAMPAVLHTVEAEYPERAVADHTEAEVILDIDIGADGIVQDVRVATPAAPQGYGFDDAAVAALRQFTFSPAMAGTEAIPVTLSYKYAFTLKVAMPEVPTQPVVPLGEFTGEVYERGTRRPMHGVVVTVFRGAPEPSAVSRDSEGDDGTEAYETTTDDRGAFRFESLPAGEWKVDIQAAGYYPSRSLESVVEGEQLNVTYRIEQATGGGFDVLVEEKRPEREVTRRVLAASDIERIPGASGDPIAVVANLPSVAQVGFGDGTLIVRGAEPADTKIFVDGVDVLQIQHFGGLRSALPSGMLENIDFYAGNFGPQYGGASAGVLDVRLKDLDPESTHGYADVSLLDSGIYLETPVGEHGAIAVAGRRSYLDYVLNAVMPDDGPVKMTTAPRYYDYQLLGTYKPTPSQKFRAFFFGSDDRMELIYKNPADMDADLEAPGFSAKSAFWRAVATHEWVPSARLKNVAQLSVGKDHHSQLLGEQFTMEFNIANVQFRDTLEHKINDQWSLRAGIDHKSELYSYDVKFPAPPKEGHGNQLAFNEIYHSQQNDKAVHHPAVFAEAEWKPFDGTTVMPGVRADYFGFVGDYEAAPRLTVRQELLPSLTAKAAAGIYHREPDIDEVDPGFGNAKLRTEYARHYSAGFEWQVQPALSIDASGFYKSLHRQVVGSDRVVSRAGADVPERYSNDGIGRVYGADIMIKHDLSRNFFGWISYTLSRSERRDSQDAAYRLFDYDQTHILTVVGNYRLPHNWELGARWRMVTGKPTTPLTGSSFDSDSDTYRPIRGRTNSGRLAGFQQLDIRLDKHWTYDQWKLTTYVDIQNVTNRDNAEGTQYNYDFTEAQTSSSIPLLTIVGLRAEF